MDGLSLGFKMLIGISFIAVLADMLMVEGTFKKYVRSILGLIMLLVMINTFTGAEGISFDFSLLNEAGAEGGIQQEITVDLASDVKLRMEDKIRTALEQKNIRAKDIDVTIDKDFNLNSIVLSLEQPGVENQAKKILTDDLQIDEKLLSFY